MKGILRILFLLFLLLFQSTGSCFAETKIFTVQHRLASEILPVVQASLSTNGKAVADNIGNTIIVNESPEIIAEIKNMLLTSDQRIPQVRVQLSFDSAGTRPGRVLSTRRGRGTAFVTVSSGSRATSVWPGKSPLQISGLSFVAVMEYQSPLKKQERSKQVWR